MNKKPDFSPALAALAALALLPACGDKKTAPVAEYIRPVKMVEIQTAAAARTYEFPGQIEAAQQSNLAFEVPGKLTSIEVKEGDFIKQDELVATLDTRDYQASLNSAEATLAEARLERERNQRLFEQDAGSKEALEKSIRTVETAQASFDKAEKAFQDTSLRAPFSGVVAKVMIDDFENVPANKTIVVMLDTSSFKAVIEIPETLWILARTGISNEDRSKRSRPEIRLTALRDTTFPATISEVSMLADPKTRTFQVTLAFTAPADLNVSPGMTAAAVIHWTDEMLDTPTNSYSVPVEAIAFDEAGEAFAWKIEPEKMTTTRVVVDAGTVENGRIVITGPFEPGDMLAGSGIAQIREGMKVKRWEP